MDSILNTIKQMLGITIEQMEFNTDLIVHINTVLNILHQLGGCGEWIQISGPAETWDLVSTDMVKCNMIKTWMYFKVKLMFDPPLNATVISSIERQISELEFRILENHNDKEDNHVNS